MAVHSLANAEAEVDQGGIRKAESGGGALFSKILSEMNDYRTGTPKRLELLREISNITGNNVIAYMANTDIPGFASAITRDDPIPMVDLLDSIDKEKGLDLIINSNGGDPDAAEKILKLCRYGGRPFRVIVPYAAKSAATLVALGADEILMGVVSELGPIDPQITVVTKTGKPKSFPANSYLDSIQSIESAIKANQGKIPPIYLPYLNTEFEPSFVDYCEKAISRAKKTAQEWLEKHMMKGDKQKAESIANKLCDYKREYLSHGKVIDLDEARCLGLKVVEMKQDELLWKKVWEYFCRVTLMFNQGSDTVKAFESPEASIFAGQQKGT